MVTPGMGVSSSERFGKLLKHVTRMKIGFGVRLDLKLLLAFQMILGILTERWTSSPDWPLRITDLRSSRSFMI